MGETLHLLELAQSRLKLAKMGLKLALRSLDQVHQNLEVPARGIEPAKRPPANDNRPSPYVPPLEGA